MRRAGRFLLGLIAAAATLLLAASFAGALHPAADAVAVFRPQLAALLVVAALVGALAGTRRALWVIPLAALAAAPSAWAFLRPETDGTALVLYQKNLLYRRRDTAPLAADIRDAAPDVLTLQEVTDGNRAVLSALSDSLPSQVFCPFARVGGVAVASRWPMIPDTPRCPEGLGLAAMRVEAPFGRVWLVSLHLHWPWPHRQPGQIDAIVPFLRGLDGPVLIGGDFNMVPWGHALDRIAAASGTARIGRAHVTFRTFSPWAPLVIDHVFAPEGAAGTTQTRPPLGSDHLGLVARFAL